MAMSVARMRAPRRMPDNPSYARADNMWQGAPIAAGHATQALFDSLAVEGATWKAESNRFGASANAKRNYRTRVETGCHRGE
jgi:hypothetical protein